MGEMKRKSGNNLVTEWGYTIGKIIYWVGYYLDKMLYGLCTLLLIRNSRLRMEGLNLGIIQFIWKVHLQKKIHLESTKFEI